VAQKKDIKRQKEKLEALKKEAEQEKARAKEAARERVLADFEKGQLGLAAAAAVTTSGAEVTGNRVHLTFCDLLPSVTCFRQAAGPSANLHSIPQQRKRSHKRLKRQRHARSIVNKLLHCAASSQTSGCPH
jgi:hypothetical protein